MQVIEKNALFTEVSAEASATVSGGGLFTAAAFLVVAASVISPGGTTVTPEEETLAFLYLINAAPAPGSIVTP